MVPKSDDEVKAKEAKAMTKAEFFTRKTNAKSDMVAIKAKAKWEMVADRINAKEVWVNIEPTPAVKQTPTGGRGIITLLSWDAGTSQASSIFC